MSYEDARVAAYFAHVAANFRHDNARAGAAVIAHMVPNTVHFVPAVNTVAAVKLVLPKPKSAGRSEADRLRSLLPHTSFQTLRRDWASDANQVVAALDNAFGERQVVLVDIGGYFAPSADAIAERMGDRLLGIMEGTENGVQKYELTMPRSVPLVTVARSPLKLPEDYLVGSSVVFSIEAVLREQAQILQTRTACVVGYGRVGRGVASVLRGRGISTTIFDIDPIATAEAVAQGFQAYRLLDRALAGASLVVCATGQRALDSRGFASLRTGAVVATVTSGDDELDLSALHVGYERSTVASNITRYDEHASGRFFWLINDGDAANFLHGAVIGPAIQLIEGEKLAAISRIASGAIAGAATEPIELDMNDRRKVASIWNEHFLD